MLVDKGWRRTPPISYAARVPNSTLLVVAARSRVTADGAEQALQEPMFLAALGVLAQFDQQGTGGVEAFAGEGGDVHGGDGVGFEPVDAVFDHPDFDRGQRLDGGRVIDADEDAHFADQGARFGDAGDLEPLALHGELARDQDEELAPGLAGLDEDFAGLELLHRRSIGQGQQVGHDVSRVAVSTEEAR